MISLSSQISTVCDRCSTDIFRLSASPSLSYETLSCGPVFWDALEIVSEYDQKIPKSIHDETKKRAHDSQVVRAKEHLKLSHGGSSYR